MTEKQHRLFFALWPNKALQDVIQRNTQADLNEYLAQNTARSIDRQNRHLTLAFIGNADTKMLECLMKQAANVNVPSFTLTLDQYGYFKKTHVIWLGCETIDPLWYDLNDALNQAISVCGYNAGKAKPIPHLTVLRKASGRLQARSFKPVSWHITEFVLVESKLTAAGANYKVLANWTLSSA